MVNGAADLDRTLPARAGRLRTAVDMDRYQRHPQGGCQMQQSGIQSDHQSRPGEQSSHVINGRSRRHLRPGDALGESFGTRQFICAAMRQDDLHAARVEQDRDGAPVGFGPAFGGLCGAVQKHAAIFARLAATRQQQAIVRARDLIAECITAGSGKKPSAALNGMQVPGRIYPVCVTQARYRFAGT